MQSCSPHRSIYTLPQAHVATSSSLYSTPCCAARTNTLESKPQSMRRGTRATIRLASKAVESRPVPSYRERLLHSLVSALSACALSARSSLGSLGARLHRAGLLARLLGRRLLALLDALTASSARATRAKGEGSERSREVACSVALPRRAAAKAWRAPFPTSMAALTMQRQTSLSSLRRSRPLLLIERSIPCESSSSIFSDLTARARTRWSLARE